MSRGAIVPGGYCPGGYCPGGCCPGGYCPGGYCPGGYCPDTVIVHVCRKAGCMITITLKCNCDLVGSDRTCGTEQVVSSIPDSVQYISHVH